MKFFIDTNIVISASLFPRGKTAQVFSYILESHDVVISSYTINELKSVFKRKFPDKIEDLEKFLENIEYTLFETPAEIRQDQFPNIRDIHDVPILAPAILSGADILLTGDKDFEEVKLKKPLIFRPAEYFKFIDK